MDLATGEFGLWRASSTGGTLRDMGAKHTMRGKVETVVKPGRKRARKRGRPTDRTPAMVEKVCHAISTSTRGIAVTCDADPSLPTGATVRRWRAEDEKFRALTDQAKEEQQEWIMTEAFAALEELDTEAMITEGEVEYPDPRIAQRLAHRKAVLDGAMKLAAKLAPRKFGQRVEVSVENPLSERLEAMARRLEQEGY